MSEARHPSGGEAGYNLVVLVVAVTVMNILLAAALPSWSQAIRREKEEELVFRGLQYAEAIRLFHQRFQRYPNKLEELLEVKPRCIRQLWKDPMTEDGKWGLIFQNDPRGNPLTSRPPRDPNNPNPEGAEPPAEGEGEDGDEPDGRPRLGGPRKGDTVQVGPIVGVYSKSPKKSILIMFGRERYDEWRFTEEVVVTGRQQIVPGLANPDPGAITNLSLRWVGRPMRFVNQIPGGTLPGGGEGDLQGNPDGRPNPSSNPRGQRGGAGTPRGPR